MKPLSPPDSHFLRAAQGWLELGDSEEAGNEISRIAPECWDHPDVLEIRWSVCAAGASWEAALEVARKLVQVAPERPSGWIHQAFSIRRALPNGLEQARGPPARLRPVSQRTHHSLQPRLLCRPV